MKLATRQVHLDFHTSEYIEGIGEKFSKKDFQEALINGNVNSITLFAKCHHSWCYYPTKIGKVHPNLSFDLLSAQIEAAHEIGVKAPIYITVGWSSNDAILHPEWVARQKDGTYHHNPGYDLNAESTEPKPPVSWINLCPASGYGQHIYDLTKEICDIYKDIDGLFYDICFQKEACWCESCIKGMKKLGFDPECYEDAKEYYDLARNEFMKNCTDILREKHKNASVYFNGGASVYVPQYHGGQTHYEMEDLPTTWGGYDKMPINAKYFAKTGKPYLGMTGKFHTMWGEFGGFKNPRALKFECASMLAYGAGCSVGDQLHPCGKMDEETYKIIGYAYDYVKQIEDYCFDAEETAKLGVMLTYEQFEGRIDTNPHNEGLIKILSENQLDFNIVLENEDFSRYDTIILPDVITVTEELAEKLNKYVINGGSLLLTGDSGLDKAKTKFLIDCGCEFIEKSNCDVDYVKALDQINENIVKSPVLFYTSSNIVKSNAEAISEVYEPYFNRTYAKYCSHQFTPNKLEKSHYPAAVKNQNVVYIAHKICKMYFDKGAQYHRDYFINALKLIYKNPVMKVKMSSAGRTRFVNQKEQGRYVLHLLYASPIQRGVALVLEDMPLINNIEVEVVAKERIKNVRLMPQNIEIEFKQIEDVVSLVVQDCECHQMVVFEY